MLPTAVSAYLDQGMTVVLDALHARLHALVKIAYQDTTPEADARFASARDAAMGGAR